MHDIDMTALAPLREPMHSCSNRLDCQVTLNLRSSLIFAGSALTTFNKGSESLQPKVIALRSLQYTSGEMLYNPDAYAEFKAKVKINEEVLPIRKTAHMVCSHHAA